MQPPPYKAPRSLSLVQPHSETLSEFHRQDNIIVLDFLTSAVASLADNKRIGAKESDDLRLDLVGIHADSDSRSQPLLVALIDQGASVLKLLEWRFGTQALSLNLLRLSLVRSLAYLQSTISKWATDLLHQADLQFNQLGLRLTDPQAIRPLIQADIPLSLVEHLNDAYQQLEVCRRQLLWANDSLVSQTGENEWLTDQAIAEAQGFEGCRSSAFLGLDEQVVLTRLVAILRSLVDMAIAFGRQLPPQKKQTYDALKLLCENLGAECDKLNSLRLPKTGELMDWEARRLTLLRTLATIIETMQLTGERTRYHRPAETHQPAQRWWLLDVVPAIVKLRLIKAKISLTEANAACNALHNYLSVKNLKPSELLPSELKPIHRALSSKVLEDLQRLEGQPIDSERLKKLKSNNLSRRERLKSLLEANASTLLLLIAMLLPFGCGLKTNVKSDVPALRPDFPTAVNEKAVNDNDDEPLQKGPDEKDPGGKGPKEGVLP